MLGHSPESFLSYSLKETKSPQSENKSYFINAPYPCLNPICNNYKELTIESYKIKPSYRTYNKEKFQTLYVTCHCGFSYYRKGPDTENADLYRRDLVTDFGELWEKELIKLWKDETLSISAISKAMGVAHNTIKQRALALGLKFPRRSLGNKIITTSSKIQNHLRKNYLEKKRKEQLLFEKTNNYRQEWLNIRAENPGAKRSELEKISPKIASWLRVNDHDWFYLNQPKAWKRTESARQIDWTVRDEECAEELRQIAAIIRDREGKPVWVKPSSIAQEFKHRDWITHSKYLKKMPLTYKALKEVTETRIDYNVRRINWAVNCIKEDGSSFAFSSIGIRAVVAWYLWKVPKIKQAIEDGIKEIKKHRGLI